MVKASMQHRVAELAAKEIKTILYLRKSSDYTSVMKFILSSHAFVSTLSK